MKKAKTLKELTDHASACRSVPVYTYEICNKWKHDQKAWTEGLVYHDGFFYESTGGLGESSVRRISLRRRGRVLKKPLDDRYYGEGLTIFRGNILQLTQDGNIGFIYSLKKLEQIGSFRYQGRRWGLTHDGEFLIVTDGSEHIQFLDPVTFELKKRVSAKDENGKPLKDLDEIEYIRGEIYANIHADIHRPSWVARLDAETGELRAWIDLAKLTPGDGDEASGIAYDASGDRLFVTGKYWPYIYQIELVLKESGQHAPTSSA